MQSDYTTLILSPSDIEQLVSHFGLDQLMDRLIERTMNAFRIYEYEKTPIPIRSGFHYDAPEAGLIEWMPVMESGKQVVVKMVGYHPRNPIKFRLPTIVSTISAYDTATGHLKALADGVFLTAFRTGAASAVASKLLAHPQSETLGLIGCGAQSITQLHAISRIFPLKTIYIFDISNETMASFKDRCAMLDLDVELVPSDIRTIVEASDIICTATSIDIGAGPLFSGLTSRPHVHINAVGSDFPGKVELPLDLLKKSFVCPDFPAQAVKEGECQQLLPEDIGADIIAVAKDPEAFSAKRTQLSVFDSTGIALEDLVALELFLECADELSLGTSVQIENMMQDAKSPYHFLQTEVVGPIQSSTMK